MDCGNADDGRFHKYGVLFRNLPIYGEVNVEKDC